MTPRVMPEVHASAPVVMASPVPIRARLHTEDTRLEALLRLAEIASRPRPLPSALEALCEEVAVVLSADVVSVYVRECRGADDRLVMRGNVGLARGVVGAVSLELGEGITGFAAELGRPVTVALATEEPRFKPVPGIGEERFPVYVAVPFRLAGTIGGVLVLQRRARSSEAAFDRDEIALATAMSTAFSQVVERAVRGSRAPDDEARHPRNRSVRLGAVTVVPGEAFGAARVLPGLDDVVPALEALDPSVVPGALDSLLRDLERALRRSEDENVKTMLGPLFADQRLRTGLVDAVRRHGITEGLRTLCKSYALAPETLRGVDAKESAWLASRAREIEDLCALLAAMLAGRLRAASGGILLVSDAPSRVIALAALAWRARALAVASPVPLDTPALALLAAARLPVVAEVGELFTWARPGDRLLVDAVRGYVRVRPSPGDLARLRLRR